jgi:polyphosphate kinase 2
MNDQTPIREAKAKSKAKAKAADKMKEGEYLKQLRELQVELCYLQDWVKETGARIILVFEGRDTAGKGGIIKAITERVSPRVFRVVALPSPSEREKTQLFMQRYIPHFPAAGEIVVFDRSWYNRAGVETVMGFCSDEELSDFFKACPSVERWMVRSGIILIKIWLEVGQEEQDRRFLARIKDPLRQWKLSPMDLASYGRWYDYSRARDAMLEATDTEQAPWTILRSDDKKRARLNGIAHILQRIPYKRIKRPHAELPRRSTKGKYDDTKSLAGRRFAENIY